MTMMMLIARLMRPQCYRVAKLLQSYLDGEVDAATAGDVAAHLETCRRCGLEASTYQAIKSAITGAAASGADADAVDAAALARLRTFAISLSENGEPPSA